MFPKRLGVSNSIAHKKRTHMDSCFVILLLGCMYNGASTSPMNTLRDWEKCQNLYGSLELMVHHTPTKARARSVPVFFHPCWSNLGVLCGQYGCSPLVWLLVQLFINLTHAPLHLYHWEGCQHMYGWLECIVHHTPSKAENESAPVCIHPPMVHPLDVIWPAWMWSPCLVAYTIVNQSHPCIHW